MDVQMAVFHRADGFLKQLMGTKLSQCQFALPLLVPDPETQQIEFPLWTFRQINKSWKIRNTNNETISQTQPIYKAQTPMVFFFRFDSVSSSKSQLMNSLINDKHNTFFHRNCPGSSRSRVLMDGVVEIAWFCPSGRNTDTFTDCVAFCNLHGDAGDHEKQWKILTEMASVNVVLLQQLQKNKRSTDMIQSLYKNKKPLIFLFTEDESVVTEMKKGKYKIGLKDRNQSEISEELRGVISDCLSESSSTVRLVDVSKHSDMRVDEEVNKYCKKGRAAAQQMISLLEEKKLTEIKESFLPHQGKLWHQWSQKNKELHRPQGDEIEMEISRKQKAMMKFRKQQHESDISEFIKLFVKKLNKDDKHEKMFFLKWLKILLDEHTSTELSALHHKYNEKWSTVLKLKKNYDKFEKIKAEQAELERISEDLQAAAFGLEHIMREIGQIYESCSSVKQNKKDLPVHFSSLPSLAAEMMISGFPLELMDGDAAHVPLVWISAVLDELVQKLGDQTRVFVLSVLGIQSSGKSTMLNAMFGLQFAVGAGRCTRGAFMQLVKVSEEMKTQMNFDYILVVDTEGLCAPELAGRSTRHHDNELATFVVGIANLTLINIFGENSSEMQDVLQIVVQAFLRIKTFKQSGSCVFVHQNISDFIAGEKNKEGRRRLLEKLDEMTKLTAEEEGCDAEFFDKVIGFDVQNDVKYFAQLWEGSPPMAPPNPKYCENIQDLKKTVIAHASESHRTGLKDLRDCVKDLWEALLKERFVFSFRNSQEISAYKKLRTQYSKWSSSVHNAMEKIENKLQNEIENEVIHEVEESDLQRELKKTSEEVEKSMTEFFEKGKDKDILIQWKASFEIKIKELQENIVREAIRKLNEILQQRDQKKNTDAQKTHYKKSLNENSKELPIKLKVKTADPETPNKDEDYKRAAQQHCRKTAVQQKTDAQKKHQENTIHEKARKLPLNDKINEETQKKELDSFRDCGFNENIISETVKIKDIDVMRDVREILQIIFKDIFKFDPANFIKENSEEHNILNSKNYKKYFDSKTGFKRCMGKTFVCHSTKKNKREEIVKELVRDVDQQTDKMIKSFNISKTGYNKTYIEQIIKSIMARATEHQEGQEKYEFTDELFIDLILFICKKADKTITDQHRMFREANDPEMIQ
nr:interferon-induced very large GTPase 1-like [Danio rerio]|eukprot:XP_017210385.1 interferon-induced very large GTPase 1-like [Danio rerio]